MRYVWVQKVGRLYNTKGWVCNGYSGLGIGKNNPAMQDVAGVGPIPEGQYSIGAAVNGTQLGPDALPLTPLASTDMHGRSGFFIHGDSLEHPGCASHGCVIVPPWVRKEMQPGDTLYVVDVLADMPSVDSQQDAA